MGDALSSLQQLEWQRHVQSYGELHNGRKRKLLPLSDVLVLCAAPAPLVTLKLNLAACSITVDQCLQLGLLAALPHLRYLTLTASRGADVVNQTGTLWDAR